MNIVEATKLLHEGKCVRRSKWTYHEHIKLENVDGVINHDGRAIRFRNEMVPFLYDSSIIMSEGWIILGNDKSMSFSEAIIELNKGNLVKLKSWPNHTHIYVSGKDLFMSRINQHDQPLTFEDFSADDWEIFE